MKFSVKATDGSMLEANQLATFAHYIKGVQFRFVVTELPGQLPVVTHRHSGQRVCRIDLTTMAACRQDMQQAGKVALARVIDLKGEDGVYAALRKAESV